MGLLNMLLGRKPAPAVTPGGVLVPIKTIVIEISERRVPSKFYRDRFGLWVWGRIPEITARAKSVAAGTKFPVQISRIGRDATDKEIEDNLPANHFFGGNGIDAESASLALLAEMMERQWKGEEGDLEHMGCANLLYLPSCVASIDRFVVSRLWRAFAWRRGACLRAGDLVLSPGN